MVYLLQCNILFTHKTYPFIDQEGTCFITRTVMYDIHTIAKLYMGNTRPVAWEKPYRQVDTPSPPPMRMRCPVVLWERVTCHHRMVGGPSQTPTEEKHEHDVWY
jgi:hypothetical protein